MADVQTTFSGVGVSESFSVTEVARSDYGSKFSLFFKPSAFVGTVVRERSNNGGADWYPIYAVGLQFFKWVFTGSEGLTSETHEATESREIWRLNCTAHTSGSLTTILSSADF
jgi:hypothetical protein